MPRVTFECELCLRKPEYVSEIRAWSDYDQETYLIRCHEEYALKSVPLKGTHHVKVFGELTPDKRGEDQFYDAQTYGSVGYP